MLKIIITITSWFKWFKQGLEFKSCKWRKLTLGEFYTYPTKLEFDQSESNGVLDIGGFGQKKKLYLLANKCIGSKWMYPGKDDLRNLTKPTMKLQNKRLTGT